MTRRSRATVSALLVSALLLVVGGCEIGTDDEMAPPTRTVTPSPSPSAAAAPATLWTSTVPATQVVRELAWREGMLSFEDMRLDQAAAEFGRYSDTRIVITDPAIGARTVTGLFAARNPTGFAETVATVLDLRTKAGPGVVELHR